MFGLTVCQLVLMIPIVLLGGGVWAAAQSGHTSVGVYAVILVVSVCAALAVSASWYAVGDMGVASFSPPVSGECV